MFDFTSNTQLISSCKGVNAECIFLNHSLLFEMYINTYQKVCEPVALSCDKQWFNQFVFLKRYRTFVFTHIKFQGKMSKNVEKFCD